MTDVTWTDIGKLALEATFLWLGVMALRRKAEIVGGKVINHASSHEQIERLDKKVDDNHKAVMDEIKAIKRVLPKAPVDHRSPK